MKDHSDIDGEVIRMLTREGFMELFWEKLRVAIKADPAARREDIFNELNEKYFKVIGCYRYSNYESFRRRLR